MKYEIDASNRILGRLATEIVVILSGKNDPGFQAYIDKEANSVEVSNVEEVKVSGNKAKGKFYWKYSGYPGGIKKTTYEELKERDNTEALRRAVYGMLPKNKLRAKRMNRLTIT